jgi:hypothetical protein
MGVGNEKKYTTVPAGGVKHDSDKRRVDLLPIDALEGVADILGHGAKKYGDRNWEGGLAWMRIVGAIMRHLFAFVRREDVDPDSGMLHVDHLACEALFLSAMARRRKDLDDRPKEGRTLSRLWPGMSIPVGVHWPGCGCAAEPGK